MKKDNTLKFAELTLLILVWIVLIVAPVLFNGNKTLVWQDFLNPMETIIPLFFIFLINRFVLVPKLLFSKRRLYYVISVIGIIAIFTFGSFLFSANPIDRRPPQEINNRRQPQPPHINRADNRFPPPKEPIRGRPMPPFANLLIISFLLIGFDTGLMASFRLAETEQEKAKLEKENVGTQLAFLRNQVSPHFFMNTLNNIHSLIDFDKEEAKESIIRLSKLMRHLLYDSEVEQIPIKKEIDFVKNYVDLMKLRFSDKVKIKLILPEQMSDKSIPPLLFTSYIENAFKHGISYQHASFINILFSITSNTLTFEVRNSNNDIKTEDNDSGIGIENSRKRLDLIYGAKYLLKIDDKKDEHCVSLTIPI